MISNKDLRVEDGNLIINGEKHPLDPAVEALTKRANTVQGKLSALDAKLDEIEALEKTASGNPISLTGVAAAYAMSNIMTIEPIQSGSGDPSPTNVRPISGLTSGEVQTTNGTDTNTATITFGQTVYGGSLNFKTGEVTVTKIKHTITQADIFVKSTNPSIKQGRAGYYLSGSNSWLLQIQNSGGDDNRNHVSMMSNVYAINTTSAVEAVNAESFMIGVGTVAIGIENCTNIWINVSESDAPTLNDFYTYIQNMGIELIAPLATPTTLTLTPAELELLKGVNTVSGNGANINLSYIGR